MILKVHRRGKEIVVAACDDDLLDKTLKHGELKIHISKNFYGTENCDEEEFLAALRMCTTANLVGKKTVELAVAAGYIRKEGIINIGDVPHAQLYKIFGNR